MELEPQLILYLLKFHKIVKIGGANSLYACTEWPGIHITQAILKLQGTKGIRFHFLDGKGAWNERLVHFYERNPAGRGLDFDDAPEDKPYFTRYAVEFRCLSVRSLLLSKASPHMIVVDARVEKVVWLDVIHIKCALLYWWIWSTYFRILTPYSSSPSSILISSSCPIVAR